MPSLSAEAHARSAASPPVPPAVQLHGDPAALGRAVAREVHATIDRTRAAGAPCLLGVPAGRTMAPVFTALADLLREQPLPLTHVVVVMMDDYLERSGGGWRRVDETLPHSCRRFGARQVLAPLNAAVGPGIPDDALWSPDPADPAAYDDAIAAHGGVELFLVAVGAGDGHVAFNPPGTPLDSRTRVLELAETTRADNTATFPHLAAPAGSADPLAAVPTHGVSVGLATIAASRHVVAAVHGASKHDALARLLGGAGFDPAFPASFLHTVPGAQLHVDAAAAGPLDDHLLAGDDQ